MSLPSDLFTLALQAHRGGDLPRAEQLCRQLVQEQPSPARPRHVLGVIATQRRQPQQALEFVERALTLQPGEPTVR